MRKLSLVCAVLFVIAVQLEAQDAAPANNQKVVGTMSELMIRIIYPSSDAVFYIATRTPETEVQWGELQGQTLMVRRSALRQIQERQEPFAGRDRQDRRLG